MQVQTSQTGGLRVLRTQSPKGNDGQDTRWMCPAQYQQVWTFWFSDRPPFKSISHPSSACFKCAATCPPTLQKRWWAFFSCWQTSCLTGRVQEPDHIQWYQNLPALRQLMLVFLFLCKEQPKTLTWWETWRKSSTLANLWVDIPPNFKITLSSFSNYLISALMLILTLLLLFYRNSCHGTIHSSVVLCELKGEQPAGGVSPHLLCSNV